MDNNNEKDIFIKYKLSKIQSDIPENIDNLFNNFLDKKGDKEDKMDVEYKKKNKITFFRKYSMAGVAAMLCIILFGGANIYATTQGYENVFFMIKYLISEEQEEITNKEEILTDKDVTISYMNIDLLEELHIQINKLEINNNIAKLKLRILPDTTELEKSLNIDFKVFNSDSGEELYFGNKEIDYENYSLILENYQEDIKNIKLEVYNNNNILSTIIINLETKEIQVLKGYELDKLSEIELKEYLGAFSFLNYCYIFDKKTEDDMEIYDNESLILSAIEIGDLLNKQTTFFKDGNDTLVADKENIDEILENVFGKKVDDNFKIGVNFETLEYNDKSYYHIKTDYAFWANGLCIEVKDASFLNGVYKVTYSYCFPYGSDFEGETMDLLPVFESSISFKYDKNSEYKYLVTDFGKPELISRGSGYYNLYMNDEIEKTNIYDY